MTVISFPAKAKDETVIFVCNCGCASFTLRADGFAECRNCEAVSDDGGWRARKDTDPDFTGQATFEDGGSTAEFAEHKAKRDVSSADWIIFGTNEGRVVSWARDFMETPEQRSWLRNGVEAGIDAILKDAPR